ncbi:hypothetical protein NTA49_07730 [Photobacterium sp. TY 1-4]|uniref:Phosphoadenosine phosphosulfate reductase n=2 Tax=Pseudosulfitobacter koreensis TaxID=2968472 RepID=A0ABT1YZW9_9RHOB|nr:hypothetical protein [Pseudosulfitobacter koreense]
MGVRAGHFRATQATAEAQGGWTRNLHRHRAVYVPRGPLLLVSFDTMDAHLNPAPRRPWAWDLAETAGWSHLGLMTGPRNDWYRQRAVFDFFDGLCDSGFFHRFDDVVFYGSSMGGFAACTFVAAAPGARVVAISPQSTLLRTCVPFERRYPMGLRHGDWEDPRYLDAAGCLQLVRSAVVLVDPCHAVDAAHVARLPDTRLAVLRCPHMGHRIPHHLAQMGGFGGLMREVIEGQGDRRGFARHLRRRKVSASYHKALIKAALARGHPALAGQVLARYRRLPDAPPLPHLARRLRLVANSA